jgi:hypothetical protein
VAKAINWPPDFRDTVINEPIGVLFCAVRLGRLYFENTYWTPDEVVDIRVGNLVVRRGVVRGSLWAGAIADLPALVYQRLKPGLQTEGQLLDYLRRNYNQALGPTAQVTVVTYENSPFDPALVEQPPKR